MVIVLQKRAKVVTLLNCLYFARNKLNGRALITNRGRELNLKVGTVSKVGGLRLLLAFSFVILLHKQQ